MRKPDQRSSLRLLRVALVSLAPTASGPLAGAGGVSPPLPRGQRRQPRHPVVQRRSPGSWRGPFSGPTLGSLSLTSRGGQRTMTRNAAVGEGAVAGLGWQERGLPSAAARGKARRAS